MLSKVIRVSLHFAHVFVFRERRRARSNKWSNGKLAVILFARYLYLRARPPTRVRMPSRQEEKLLPISTLAWLVVKPSSKRRPSLWFVRPDTSSKTLSKPLKSR